METKRRLESDSVLGNNIHVLYNQTAYTELAEPHIIGVVRISDHDVLSATAMEPLLCQIVENAAGVERIQTDIFQLVVVFSALSAEILPSRDAREAQTDVEDQEQQGVGQAEGGIDGQKQRQLGVGEAAVRHFVGAQRQQKDARGDGKREKHEKVPVVSLAQAVGEPGTVVVHVGDADATLVAMGRSRGPPDVAGVAVLEQDGGAGGASSSGRAGELEPAVVLDGQAVFLQPVHHVDVFGQDSRVQERRLEQVGEGLQPAVEQENDCCGRHVVPEPAGLEDQEQHQRQHRQRHRYGQHGDPEACVCYSGEMQRCAEPAVAEVDVVGAAEGLEVLRGPAARATGGAIGAVARDVCEPVSDALPPGAVCPGFFVGGRGFHHLCNVSRKDLYSIQKLEHRYSSR